MHDKMVLAHYPKTNTSGERWTVMIGSSGLTRNVDQNWNYENLLIIDDKALFDSMMVHHRDAERYRQEGIAPLDRTSPLGRACSLLEHHVSLRPDHLVGQDQAAHTVGLEIHHRLESLGRHCLVVGCVVVGGEGVVVILGSRRIVGGAGAVVVDSRQLASARWPAER